MDLIIKNSIIFYLLYSLYNLPPTTTYIIPKIKGNSKGDFIYALALKFAPQTKKTPKKVTTND
jgi:hypothetical protein